MIKKTIYLSPKEEIPLDGKILYRQASRAIIMKDDLILMVYSKVNKDYKFPGGGIEEGESKIDALFREASEEVGCIVTKVNSQFACITTINNESILKDYDIFQMESNYYLCEIEDDLIKQNLSKYELDLGFIPKWVRIEDAIKINLKVLKSKNIPRWTLRETMVLKMLKKMID